MTNLNFTQNAKGEYVSSFVSSGEPTVVQLKRVTAGGLDFKVNIGSMDAITLRGFSKYQAGADFITCVNIPSGVTLTIISDVQVTSAGYEG